MPAVKSPATKRPLRVFISAGEHSGDSHGAALAKRLREREPDIVLQGLGGPLMAAAGVDLVMDFVQHAAMGIIPVLKNLPFFRATLKDTAARLAAEPPDVLVPIDYPGFNLRLAGRARKAGVRVCYYVSPQVWAWRPGRIKRIARLVDHMMVLFPFERALYEAQGVPCTFVGHPLFDELRLRRPSPDFRAADLNVSPETPLVGLLPGSRRHEVTQNYPWELLAARRLHELEPAARFVTPIAQPDLRPLAEELVAEHAPDLPLTLVDGKASDVARVARASVTVSGTATLELLHYECPMVIVYRLGRAQTAIKEAILTTPWIALVNVLAQREICPEFVTHKDPTEEVARHLLGLIRPGKARKQSLTRLRNLRREVDVKNQHHRAAEAVLEVARAARDERSPGAAGS
jgi:lipid-A-disaccharide synthase